MTSKHIVGFVLFDFAALNVAVFAMSGASGLQAFISSANDYAQDDPSTWNEDIYVTTSDGQRGPIQITATPENDHWPPSWAPDGEWLAYTNDLGTSGSRIAIVLPTGEPTYLTDGAYDAFPAWRPEPGT